MTMCMNVPELLCYLKDMASTSMNKKYDEYVYKAIITVIINHYITFPAYREEDAIRTFKKFLNTGVLLW